MSEEIFDINAEMASEAAPAAPARNSDGTFAARTEAAPASEPVRATHPHWLVKQAEQVGISAAEAAEMDQQTLGTTVTHLWRNQLQYQQELAAQNARQRMVQEGQVRTPPPEDDLQLDWGNLDGKPLREEDYDPHVAGLVKSLGKSQARRIKDLEAKLGQLETVQHNTLQSKEHEKIDAAFAAVDMEKVFGAGSIEELDPNSPQRKRRLAAFAAAGLEVGKLPPKGQLLAKLKEAANALFGSEAPAGDPYAQAAPAAPGRPTPAEWQGGGLTRPTQRTGAAEPKGEELAIRNLAAKMRTGGNVPAVGDQELLNGIPD